LKKASQSLLGISPTSDAKDDVAFKPLVKNAGGSSRKTVGAAPPLVERPRRKKQDEILAERMVKKQQEDVALIYVDEHELRDSNGKIITGTGRQLINDECVEQQI
jgi:hypothetical protein